LFIKVIGDIDQFDPWNDTRGLTNPVEIVLFNFWRGEAQRRDQALVGLLSCADNLGLSRDNLQWKRIVISLRKHPGFKEVIAWVTSGGTMWVHAG
jgi:hypothetical protein